MPDGDFEDGERLAERVMHQEPKCAKVEVGEAINEEKDPLPKQAGHGQPRTGRIFQARTAVHTSVAKAGMCSVTIRALASVAMRI